MIAEDRQCGATSFTHHADELILQQAVLSLESATSDVLAATERLRTRLTCSCGEGDACSSAACDGSPATKTCAAALNVKGEHFPCDQPTDKHGQHAGWAHNNRHAQAIWTDDPDAIAQGWTSAEAAGR